MHAVLDRIKRQAFEALVLAFAIASVVEAIAAPHVQHRAVVALLALGWTLPFALRRRYPLWAPLVVLAFLAAFGLISPERSISSLTMPFVAALAAAVSLGLVGDRRQSIAGWAGVIATAAVISSKSANGYSDFFWTTLILTLAWFFGSALGTRTEQARELTERVEAAERVDCGVAGAVAARDIAGLDHDRATMKKHGLVRQRCCGAGLLRQNCGHAGCLPFERSRTGHLRLAGTGPRNIRRRLDLASS
jgi:hypothetical protein